MASQRLLIIPVFFFEVRSKDPGPDALFDLLHVPEPDLGDLDGIKCNLSAVPAEVGPHILGFDRVSKRIGVKKREVTALDPQFLFHLAADRSLVVLADIQMAAHGRVPFTGLDILGRRAFLQQDPSLFVDQQDMDNPVHEGGVPMAFGPEGLADHMVLLIDNF